MSDRVAVLVFAEKSFVSLRWLPSLIEARAFAAGVNEGASHYGAGGCNGHVWPDDEARMREWENTEEVTRAIETMKKGVDT